MKSMFKRKGSSKEQEPPTAEASSGIQFPTTRDVFRYRYHHGTNLGSVFILERWLTPSMFHESTKGSSEYAAAEGWIKVEGIEEARERFERHWREYVSRDDLYWLQYDARVSTVRLPIGYFTLGPQFCEHTPFKKVAAVYQNAWEACKLLIERCKDRGIGVLIDIHGLPGGANAQDHSGTNSGKAELWGSRTNLELATKCVCFIARETREMENVAGIQIVNEAEWDAKGMFEWYDHVLSEVSRIDAAIPIYISDAWNLHHTLAWSQSKNTVHAGRRCNPVIVDNHLYWCFSDEDKRKSPQQITYEVSSKLNELDGRDGSVTDRGAAQVIVGEYSCALDEGTWSRAHGEDKQHLTRGFGNSQSQRYQHRAGGSFFWTYRMDWMPGYEWGLRDMVEKGAIVPPAPLTLSIAEIRKRTGEAKEQEEQRKHEAVTGHCQYWDGNYPGHYEHWRFEQGWEIGFQDAMAFFGMRGQHDQEGGDKIGMLDLWCLKRLRESAQNGPLAWEFEHGLRQGIRGFYECAGV